MSLDWNKTNELFVLILPPTQKIDLIYDDPHKLSFTVSHAQTETNPSYCSLQIANDCVISRITWLLIIWKNIFGEYSMFE